MQKNKVHKKEKNQTQTIINHLNNTKINLHKIPILIFEYEKLQSQRSTFHSDDRKLKNRLRFRFRKPGGESKELREELV